MPRVAPIVALFVTGLLLGACGQTVVDMSDPAPATPSPDVGFTVDVDEVEAAPPPSPDSSEVIADMGRRAAAAAVPPAPAPAHLRIPAIGVDTATIELNLTADTAEVPASYDIAGWYRQTRTPGTVGPAVVVGHVGSRAGPGVFAALDQLVAGDEIEVTDVAGTTRSFVVSAGALVDKYDRPPEVFGWVGDRPELRLITCGGDFDPSTGHHVSNYVIWAHEVGT